METKANYAIVGFFTLLVIAAAFGFVYWMAQSGRGGPVAELAIRIPGSANGLSVGSPVRFNGIPVGSVRNLSIDPDDPQYSIAFTEVRADAPVFPSTKAVLEVQGLTGAAYIELSGGNKGEESILRQAIDTGRPAVLIADQSSVTNLLATADKILERANDAIGDLQGFVADARGPLTQTIRNAEVFSASLSSNAGAIDDFLESMSALSVTFNGVSQRVDSTLAAAEELVRAVDAEKINAVVTNAERVSLNVANASDNLDEIAQNIRSASSSFQQVTTDARSVVQRADTLMAAINPQNVGTAVNNLTAASEDARSALSSAREVVDGVANQRDDINRAINDFTELAQKLNNASNRVDGILAKVDTMLSGDDSESLFAEASRTLQSFRTVADNINGRVGPIADSLQRFSASGLRDIQTLVEDTRRTVRSLDSTITNFDENPQRLIFGGETVKQYDGRTRR
ncbi:MULTISPECIES: MlaD family protein [Pseudorhizobium]|uniref:Organic solvent ABC transporter substrate-binding protein n=1 Tax=Pseudorhizobium pelagicum TaxID=1509405 RepID=A0A922P6A4_9HYPH|nr:MULTISPECIES: MlaD family protein [Pseudorhizobium]MBU1315620.1 MCE family protein [Alphaproteobacteria bacterium]KEQ06020.1 organic solvent ABC transporter substrate-binding protein [Pseudorhizobium pelagicum]KEQ11135.1 organic solvent ABC transporter substrate-binding protein [Pseudorhizobium pelagicum]MBU1550951.1 MCE family protein [Alphaproteobacteria bacterium]MBU2339087.1 MCE family protein [Alphaproteobacteria bacterium]|tara:strand:- start:242 stop:1612 length:1371 start_codon:yes stop_codon:yes gene_type:complete